MQEKKDELAKIDNILSDTVRPFMKRDGGDLKLINLEGNVLTISYQGACGGCPHAKMGTLMAIEGALKEKYHPDITVKTID